MKNETQSLFIATPCIGNLVTLDFMKSMLDVLAWVKTKEIPIRFYWHSGSQDIVAKRNTCVAEFLNDSATYSHLLFVDADVAFEVETLEKEIGFATNENNRLFCNVNEDNTAMGLKYERLVPILVNAIKELSAENEALSARITTLDNA